MYKWCARHAVIAVFLWTIPVIIIGWALFRYIEVPIWIAAAVAYIMLVAFALFVFYSARQLLIIAEKSLNDQCDPYPLIKETQAQMKYNFFINYGQSLLVDYCAALISIGECSKALENMKSLNLDNHLGVSPVLKVIYYINLASIYLSINETDKAEACHNKSIQMLNDLKNQKHKQMLSTPIQQNAAEIFYHKKDFEKSIEILNNCPEGNMRDSVATALLFAENYISQGKIEDAKIKLQFVIENGNKLIYVLMAKDLLANNT